MNNPKPYANHSAPFRLAAAILGRKPPLSKSDVSEFAELEKLIPAHEAEDFAQLWEGVAVMIDPEVLHSVDDH